MRDDLESSDLAFLIECRRVALENLNFYEPIYDQVPRDDDRAIIGGAMAQKRAFIEATEAIISSQDAEAEKLSTRDVKVAGLPQSENNPNLRETKRFWKMIYDHEARFISALVRTHDQIKDKTTRDVLNHHIKACQLALDAMGDGNVKAVF